MSEQTIDPRKIAYVRLEELKGDPRNPKDHDDDVIDQSIGRFGVIDLIVRDERTGLIVSGHGRTKALTAMRDRGESAPEGVQTDPETGDWLVPVVTGWASRTDAEAGAALIAMNRTTELGGWVDDALLDLLDDLSEMEGGFDGVGFELQDIADLRESIEAIEHEDFGEGEDAEDYFEGLDTDDEGDSEPHEPSGSAFKLLDVTVGEPKHKVHWGEVYELGGRHLLVVAKLAREHHKWSDLLEGRVFAPYPDVYLLLGAQPKTEEFLCVQPNFYLAGHTLDKWVSVHGEESVQLLEVRS